MIVQFPEVISYRQEEYDLVGTPLEMYLQGDRKLKFNSCTINTLRGYKGTWLLKDNCLYITNIESIEYTYEGIFGTNNPVFAEWFSGVLKFGIGNFYQDDWGGFYDEYLWIRFEDGKVLEKKILHEIRAEEPISFGKYKGRDFNEVLFGRVKHDFYAKIKGLIDSLMKFITDLDYSFAVICGRFKIEKDDVQLVRDIRKHGIGYFITHNYIAVSSVDLSKYADDEMAEDLSNLLEKMLQGKFISPFTLIKSGLEEDWQIAEDTVLLNSDVQYLVWALKNVNSFCVNPLNLKQEFKIKRLKSFAINRLNKTIFEYTPITDIISYQFPVEALLANKKKFELKHEVLYDDVNGILVSNFIGTDLVEHYGFYLNESYIMPSRITDLDYSRNITRNRDEYHNSDDNWLRDAAGTNDPEVMNDTFWNID